jgi:tetratricopeptide (TPR) repeat protein
MQTKARTGEKAVEQAFLAKLVRRSVKFTSTSDTIDRCMSIVIIKSFLSPKDTMDKICFVIMPYGGSDESAKKRYTGIYQSIIAPAAARAGFRAKRSDLESSPGNIAHDIINELASASMVIADLSSANPNVFFELGIRHAFRKSGTVHIINKEHSIPFDVKNYRAIEYSTELADISTAIDQIYDAIQKREESPERSDNPVHDAIADLPINILAAGDHALREQIKQLQIRIDKLDDMNHKLQARIYELDPSESYKSEEEEDISIDKLFDEAEKIRLSTGENALLRLTQQLEEGGQDAFIDSLRATIKNPYLSAYDFLSIARICSNQQLLDHRRAVLEVASMNYPNNEDIHLALIDAYNGSPNKVYQARGRVLIEKYLGITHTGEGPKLVNNISKKKADGLSLLFNFYYRIAKPEWVEAIAIAAKQQGLDTAIVLRNLARAYEEQGNNEDAEKMYLYAIEQHPRDDTAYVWYGDFLDTLGKYAPAYENTEKGILADPDDGSRFLGLGQLILARGFVRDSNKDLIGPVDREIRLKHAIPFFVKALELGGQRSVNSITSLLVQVGAIPMVEKIIGKTLLPEDYDLSSFNAVLAKLNY